MLPVFHVSRLLDVSLPPLVTVHAVQTRLILLLGT